MPSNLNLQYIINVYVSLIKWRPFSFPALASPSPMASSPRGRENLLMRITMMPLLSPPRDEEQAQRTAVAPTRQTKRHTRPQVYGLPKIRCHEIASSSSHAAASRSAAAAASLIPSLSLLSRCSPPSSTFSLFFPLAIFPTAAQRVRFCAAEGGKGPGHQ